jgi:prevent-host-death family protein
MIGHGQSGIEVLDDMTRSDYHLVMKQTVQIARLKAQLSGYLRSVRRGGELVVLDRKTPVARILPYDEPPHRLQVRPPLPDAVPLSKIDLPPFPCEVPDVMPFLLDDRESGR